MMNEAKFYKLLAVVNGAVPLVLLGWDAIRGELGANSVNHAIRTTGMLALIFLMLSLAVTPIKRLTGWNLLISIRRALGLYAFFYASLHLAIYVVFDRALSLSSTLHEITTRRYLQVGITGLLLMLPLATTSTNAMIHRLGTRRWKALHRLAYIAGVAGVLHYFLLVKADLRKPIAFAIVLSVLLISRFVWHYLDLRRAAAKGSGAARRPNESVVKTAASIMPPAAKANVWSGELTVARIFRETPDVCTFRLMSPDGGELPFAFAPGQFLTIQIPGEGKKISRSYTIASSASQRRYCEITVRRISSGKVSNWLHQELKEGQQLRVTAPAGRFTFHGDQSEGMEGIVLIAGGVGITPLMSIVRYLTDACWSAPIVFMIVAKTQQDLIFRDELRQLAARFPNLRLHITLTRTESGDGWQGARGRLTPESLQQFADELSRLPVFLCGPNDMMAATRSLLAGLGVPESRIRTETFGREKSSRGNSESVAEPAMSSMNLTSSDPLVIASQANTVGIAEFEVSFQKSGKQLAVTRENTVLEASEIAGVDLPFECRAGVCGQCRTRLVSGRVTMDSGEALSAQDKASGYILACQSRCQTDITVAA